MPRRGSWGIGPDADPMQMEALSRMTEALKIVRTAKRRGVDVKPARPLVDACARAFFAGDYARVIDLADEVALAYSESVSLPPPTRNRRAQRVKESRPFAWAE